MDQDTEPTPTPEADPYGWAMAQIRTALQFATTHSGAMSQGEFAILGEVARTIAEEDPGFAVGLAEDLLQAPIAARVG